MQIKHNRRPSRSWDAVADWYVGWSGPEGSRHHKRLAIPALIDLLRPQPGEGVLDIGCGAGALAPAIMKAGAAYTGVDLGARLIAHARKHHRGDARFVVGDATRLAAMPDLRAGTFDAAAFLLSIQDIEPLEGALASAAWALKPGGRLVLLMTHPCFRIPRQSGWGWDEGRRLQFRRIDRYLTPLDIPMQEYGDGRRGTTRSYHRPLETYVSALAGNGLVVDALREVAGGFANQRDEARAARLAQAEIPLFLCLRATRR
ncbi:class I SAM-dependent methyltransferase [Devosia nitrariae]|uniref:Methyltransferase n=1 Tax=Devosia nitrariae TaxID=2071872 RepID=A0ABQ5W6V3_9HYPH|nr:class I SAM-dependent methyltransferase [Devosia nitrariae]GLQ55526.1 methyltransferase [Devosia nitrariae]